MFKIIVKYQSQNSYTKRNILCLTETHFYKRKKFVANQRCEPGNKPGKLIKALTLQVIPYFWHFKSHIQNFKSINNTQLYIPLIPTTV